MRTDHPLTLTVEQAGHLLGVGRSTAYELIRSGDLQCIRLRRRIVISVAHVADRLGVTSADVRTALGAHSKDDRPNRTASPAPIRRSSRAADLSEAPTLF